MPAWPQFEARSTRSIPSESVGFAVGDFNNDGKLDLAVVSDGFNIALGNGDGTFQAPVTYPYLTGGALAVGDFNGDGNLDLVSTSYTNNEVEVFLGNGDGTFQAPIASPTTQYPSFVIVGDFNGDRKLDIAIIDLQYISILLGNGDGTFQSPSDNESFVGPQNLAVGDFNNDHKLDVAAVGYFGGGDSVGVLLGNGDGTLQSSITYQLSDTPDNVSVGDFNRDGNLDVVVGDLVTVFLGNGDGTLQPGVSYLGATGDVVVSDFNGDGILDIATQGYPLGLAVFYGRADGTFGAAQEYSTGPNGFSPLVGDFNGDGKPDIAFLAPEPGVNIILNTGSARFTPASPIEFFNQLVNTVGPAQIVTLTNIGKKPLSISSIRGSGQFKISTSCGKSLASGADCHIDASFAPTTKGSHTGLITVVDSASSRPEVIELAGSGTVVTLSPSSLTFAKQKVGSKSASQQVLLTNTGAVPLNITKLMLHGFNPGDFSESNNCPSSLSAKGSCTVVLTFDPQKTGSRSAILYVTDTGGGSPQTVTMTGTGD